MLRCERCGAEPPLFRLSINSIDFGDPTNLRDEARATVCDDCRLVVKAAIFRALRPVGLAAPS